MLKEHEIAEELDRQSARDRPMMVSNPIRQSLAKRQMAMAWRNDGQHLALGLHNKSLLTLYVGGLL
jgi:hypothetical protein